MTPTLLGAPYAIWRWRHTPLVWTLVISCVLVYVPVGFVMGTGFITFGPRYLLDLMVPIVVLTALGITRWHLSLLRFLLLISVLTYGAGSALWWLRDYTLR